MTFQNTGRKMDSSALPTKCINIAALPIKDVKTRRLFILADGKRSLQEIIKLSGMTEEKALDKLQDMVDGNFISLEKLDTNQNSPHFTANDKNHNFILEVTETLAEYIGPFATVVMSSFTAPIILPSDKQKIINRASMEIESTDARETFLNSLKASGII